MKKTLMATAIAAGLTFGAVNTATASDGFYVGFGMEMGSGTHKVGGDYFIASGDPKLDSTVTSFKIGYAYDQDKRIEGSFNSISADLKGFKSESFSSMELDMIRTFGRTEIKPYLLFGFGGYTWKDSGEQFGILGGDDLSGFGFNLGAGVYYELNDSFDIQAGAKWKYIKWQDLNNIYTGATLEQSTTMLNFGLGINYKF